MVKDRINKVVIKKIYKNQIKKIFSAVSGGLFLLTMSGKVINFTASGSSEELFVKNYSQNCDVDIQKKYISNDNNSSNNLYQNLDINSYTYNPDLNFLLFNYSNVTNENLFMFPNNIETLKFYYCPFITDLSCIPLKYPNLHFLEIYCCPSISDLSFIYDLKNIQTIYIHESAFITQELLDYLNINNINHNLTRKDVMNSKKVDDIVNELITDEMNDEKKIQNICGYVIDNYSYDIEMLEESNAAPLTTMLEGNTCVCAGYAYFTNVLLTKANIKSYEIISDDHGWNLVELDGKFYYIDTTNINQFPFISQLFLEKFNMGFYYMTSPSEVSLSSMDSYDSNVIIIPKSLVDDIRRGESEKNLYEKYGNSIPIRIIELLIVIEFVPIFFTGLLIIDNKNNKSKIKKYSC